MNTIFSVNKQEALFFFFLVTFVAAIDSKATITTTKNTGAFLKNTHLPKNLS